MVHQKENASNSKPIESRYRELVDRLRSAEIRFNRSVGGVRLVAVSKKQSSSAVRTVNNLGQQDFGENQLQESLTKIKELSDLTLSWHFIGSIQTNKCRDIAIHFDWVHSIDRLKLAERLSAFRPIGLKPLNLFLQVNLQKEPTKSGINPNDLLQLASNISKLKNLRVQGLMAIPKPSLDFNQQRQVFKLLRNMQADLNRALNLDLQCLSIGMTDDLEAAVAEGATHVRIGTAIFGPRE